MVPAARERLRDGVMGNVVVKASGQTVSQTDRGPVRRSSRLYANIQSSRPRSSQASYARAAASASRRGSAAVKCAPSTDRSLDPRGDPAAVPPWRPGSERVPQIGGRSLRRSTCWSTATGDSPADRQRVAGELSPRTVWIEDPVAPRRRRARSASCEQPGNPLAGGERCWTVGFRELIDRRRLAQAWRCQTSNTLRRPRDERDRAMAGGFMVCVAIRAALGWAMRLRRSAGVRDPLRTFYPGARWGAEVEWRASCRRRAIGAALRAVEPARSALSSTKRLLARIGCVKRGDLLS
jgi:hypothetical protein